LTAESLPAADETAPFCYSLFNFS